VNTRTLLALSLAAATALGGAAFAQTSDTGSSNTAGAMQPIPNPPESSATTQHKTHRTAKKAQKKAAKTTMSTSSSMSSEPSTTPAQ
jgi:hypothetical protein